MQISARLRAPLALLLLALAAPCGAAGLLDRINPFASFETRCERLPAARYEVVSAPITFTEDHTLSLTVLTAKHAQARVQHRTVGLTETNLAYESTIETVAIEERGGRTCARPAVRIVFSATPMVVFIASEFEGCRRDMVREHEMRHVAVYREYLSELVRRASREVPAALGDRVVYARNTHEARQILRTRLRDFMQPFMDERYAEIKARHAEIDSPEEYARLGRGCASAS